MDPVEEPQMEAQETETTPQPEPPETLEFRVKSLEDALEAKDEEVRELREQVKRSHADFENFRRRQQAAQEDMRLMAKESVFGGLLPLVDNLERAVEAARSSQNLEALVSGLDMVIRQMHQLLDKEGVKPYDASGQPFDPALHHAIFSEERDDLPDDTVIEELQRGYKLGERVLRPSMVKVSRAKSEKPA